MTCDEIVSDCKSRMKKAVHALQEQLRTLRTGRASTALVENVKVDYYGNPTALKQLAALATPQVDMIVIKPFDPGLVTQIEKAIKNSDMSISPVVDGKIIRLSIPPLSEERRKQLAGQAKQTGEQTKVSVRSIRRDVNKHIEKQQKDKIITEDEQERAKKSVDELTKNHTDEIDRMVKEKSDEIVAV